MINACFILFYLWGNIRGRTIDAERKRNYATSVNSLYIMTLKEEKKLKPSMPTKDSHFVQCFYATFAMTNCSLRSLYYTNNIYIICFEFGRRYTFLTI